MPFGWSELVDLFNSHLGDYGPMGVQVLKIIWINILLSGDNAVVIALACRKLPPAQRTKGILWGTAGAIVLRVVLIFFALTLLAIPFLKLAGAVLLLWIGVKLLAPEHDDAHGNITASDKLWGAVKTVIVADLVMSVDNVLGVAAAAKGSVPLLVFGLLVSIPLVIAGSQIILKLIERFPLIILAGGGLLGWIAGKMLVEDTALQPWIAANAPWLDWAGPVAGVAIVLAGAQWHKWRAVAGAR